MVLDYSQCLCKINNAKTVYINIYIYDIHASMLMKEPEVVGRDKKQQLKKLNS